MTEKEKEIQKHMEKLGLTRQEAEQLWEEDNSDTVLPEVAEMEKKAKTMKRRYESSDKPRKAATKERKVDQEKQSIINLLLPVLTKYYDVTSVQTETEIHFATKESDFTLKLTRHRKATK